MSDDNNGKKDEEIKSNDEENDKDKHPIDIEEEKNEVENEIKEEVVKEKDENDDNLVEIQDPDDYLLYLESILIRIHQRFYEQYEKTNEIPDLKILIPQLKSEVLVGVTIVFSGLVPNNVKLEYSRPYLVAKNLGAKVIDTITEETTHLVAASTGTQKVFQAQKNKNISIVTPEWLWTVAERWDHVEEKLFPLSVNRSYKMRQIPVHCSPERIPDANDVKFNNPFLQMSDDDIASMEAEVEDDSSDTDSDDEREDTPEVDRAVRKRKRSKNEGEASAKIIVHSIDISGGKEEEAVVHNSSESGKSGNSSDSETLFTKFRRGTI